MSTVNKRRDMVSKILYKNAIQMNQNRFKVFMKDIKSVKHLRSLNQAKSQLEQRQDRILSNISSPPAFLDRNRFKKNVDDSKQKP